MAPESFTGIPLYLNNYSSHLIFVYNRGTATDSHVYASAMDVNEIFTCLGDFKFCMVLNNLFEKICST